MVLIGKSLALFVLAGLCEIGGGYLVWQWWRGGARWFGAEVVGIEPDPHMLKRARGRAARLGRQVKVLRERAEELPFGAASFDVAVATLVFCTIPEVDRALGELRRVLRQGGQLRFLEHARAKTAGWARFQDMVTPLWKQIGAGCHPNRDVVGSIQRAGFRIEELQHYAFGPYPVRPFVRGIATRL